MTNEIIARTFGAVALVLFMDPGANRLRAETQTHVTVQWKDLPNKGDRRGPWIFSTKSMPFLLAGKYSIVNITRGNSIPLSFNLPSGSGPAAAVEKGVEAVAGAAEHGASAVLGSAGVNMPTSGLSYYLQRSSSLFRCDEVGFGNEYVACWEFQPQTIEGIPIQNPSKLVGAWHGVAVRTTAHFEFTDTQMTYSEQASVGPITVPMVITQDGNHYTVHSSLANWDFSMDDAGNTITYRSSYYNGTNVVLGRD